MRKIFFLLILGLLMLSACKITGLAPENALPECSNQKSGIGPWVPDMDKECKSRCDLDCNLFDCEYKGYEITKSKGVCLENYLGARVRYEGSTTESMQADCLKQAERSCPKECTDIKVEVDEGYCRFSCYQTLYKCECHCKRKIKEEIPQPTVTGEPGVPRTTMPRITPGAQTPTTMPTVYREAITGIKTVPIGQLPPGYVQIPSGIPKTTNGQIPPGYVQVPGGAMPQTTYVPGQPMVNQPYAGIVSGQPINQPYQPSGISSGGQSPYQVGETPYQQPYQTQRPSAPQTFIPTSGQMPTGGQYPGQY